MASNVKGNLSRISRITPELNKLADQATEQIRSLDQFLAQQQFGVSYVLDNKFADGRERNAAGAMADADYHIGYDRDDDGKMGLIVKAFTAGVDAEGREMRDAEGYAESWHIAWIRPLGQVSRELRISAIAAIPELIEALAKKAESTVEALRGNLAGTQSIVDELKAALPALRVVGVSAKDL